MTACPSNISTRAKNVADDRGPQMADVHLLGDIHRRVVDHDLAGLVDGRHAEAVGCGWRSRDFAEIADQEIVF